MSYQVDFPSSFLKRVSMPEYRALTGDIVPTTQTVATLVSDGTKNIRKQITDQLFNHVIGPATTSPIFNDSENGELTGFEIATDNANVILQVYVYADNLSVINYINNLQMHELLSLGRGLSPGEVQPLPNGQSQDIPGHPSTVYPYLARFKYDSVPDFTSQFTTNLIFGQQPNIIVLKYEPTIPIAYKQIVANIINTDPENNATIISLDIKRLIHEQVPLGEAPAVEAEAKVRPVVKRTQMVQASQPTYGFPRKQVKHDGEEIAYEPQEV